MTAQIYPGVTVEQVKAATGWDLKASADLALTEEPDPEDLRVLRDLKRRARLTHAPNLVLIYESGPIDTRPDVLPLSIGDGELAKTATTVVSTSELRKVAPSP
jgi:acyl CoA:acetate/3-ketoacid CoA transferase beta subunit